MTDLIFTYERNHYEGEIRDGELVIGTFTASSHASLGQLAKTLISVHAVTRSFFKTRRGELRPVTWK